MTTEQANGCRQLFAENEDNEKFADLIESRFPHCACEGHSVGTGSPGPVADTETLHRFIVSPRDYDPIAKQILARPFEKVFLNGLSVCRDIATDADVSELLVDGLVHKKGDPLRQIWAVCEVLTSDVRNLHDDNSERIFGVYDQTVCRADPEKPHVPTHAGVFQRSPVQGTQDRKKRRKDSAGRLRDLFLARLRILEEIRSGLLVGINVRARAGEFQKNQ